MAHLRPGIYQHYKGQLYQVIEVATHSETEEKLVVYRPLYGERELWVRPLAMFDEQIDVNGVLVPRFSWQSPGQSSLQSPLQSAPQVAPVSKIAASAQQAEQAQATQVQTKSAAQTQVPASMEERVKMAMSSSDDKPDFAGIPLFEDRATAIKVAVAVVVVLLLLIWLF